MSEYDLLAEQQLTGMDPRSSLNNHLALEDTAKPASTVASPSKRKRSQLGAMDESPTKIVKRNKIQPAIKKLRGVKKPQPTWHTTSIQPAIKGDIWDPANGGGEKPQSSQTANTKMQRSKKAVPERALSDGPIEDQRNPVSGASRPTPATTRSELGAPSTEGHVSAVLKGRVNLDAKTGRKRGRPKKETNIGKLGNETKRSKAMSEKNASSVKQVNAPPPITSNTRAKKNEPVQADCKVTQVQKGRKGSSKKSLQATIEEDDDNDDEDEAGRDDLAKNLRSDQSGAEEDVIELEKQDSGSEIEPQLEGDGDDEVEEEHMDLLGQHRDWEKVLKEAKSVHPTGLKTETIRTLNSEIKKARSLYKRMEAPEAVEQNGIKGLMEQLEGSLTSIEDQINDVSELNAARKRSETIKDIYGRAIPSMVLLLDRAFTLRTSLPRGLYKYHALKEVVRIQSMIIQLCEKAKRWSVRPNTSHPIVKPTTAVIYPYIRDMNKNHFLRKLKEFEIEEMRKEDRRYTARKEETRRQEESQREAEVPAQRRSILEEIEQHRQHRLAKRNQWRKPLMPSAGPDSRRVADTANVRPVQRSPEGSIYQWSLEERRQLLFALADPRHCHLSCKEPQHTSSELTNFPLAEERYRAALTNPALHNLLPEHIRSEFLRMKPTIIHEIGNATWLEGLD